MPVSSLTLTGLKIVAPFSISKHSENQANFNASVCFNNRELQEFSVGRRNRPMHMDGELIIQILQFHQRSVTNDSKINFTSPVDCMSG